MPAAASNGWNLTSAGIPTAQNGSRIVGSCLRNGAAMPTQAELAAHVFCSITQISGFCRKHKIDWKKTTIKEFRRLYIAALKDQGANSQFDLAKERARTEKVDRQLKAMKLAEAAGELVPLEPIKQEWIASVIATRTELLQTGAKIEFEIKTEHGIEIPQGLIERHLRSALERLAADAESGSGGDSGSE